MFWSGAGPNVTSNRAAVVALRPRCINIKLPPLLFIPIWRHQRFLFSLDFWILKLKFMLHISRSFATEALSIKVCRNKSLQKWMICKMKVSRISKYPENKWGFVLMSFLCSSWWFILVNRECNDSTTDDYMQPTGILSLRITLFALGWKSKILNTKYKQFKIWCKIQCHLKWPEQHCGVTSMKAQVAITLANEISPLGVHKMKLALICAVMHP